VADRPPRPGKHAARHRAPTALDRACDLVADGLSSLPRRTLPTAVASGALAMVAVAATTGLSGGEPATPRADGGVAAAARGTAADSVSRNATRPSLSELKSQTLLGRGGAVGRHRGTAEVGTEEVVSADSDPRDIARAMLAQYGWSETEFSCLDQLWISESDWDPYATNPTSGAYGIPQSLPAEKMAAAGPDWRTNPMTQIEWGLSYIQQSYGTPCAANAFKVANNWY